MKRSIALRMKRLGSDSEGGALVEMAVTLPLIMLIMTGIFSFSMALYQKLQLAEAVSNAGRYLATARGVDDPCARTINAVYDASPGLSHDSKVMTITLTQDGTNLPATCPTTATSETLTQGHNVSILVTYNTNLAVYGSGFSALNLQSQIAEVVQ